MLHDTIAVVLGGDGSWIVKKLTHILVENVAKLWIARRGVGYLFRPMLVLDWHVCARWTPPPNLSLIHI